MDINEVVSKLDSEWDDCGFLGRLREGNFSVDDGERFLKFLNSIEIAENSFVPKRLISLIWYLPIFLRWQSERVQEYGTDRNTFNHFITKVDNILEGVLGVP